MDYELFLSHNSKDIADAREVADALGKLGFRVFLSEKSLRPGDPWPREIEEAISLAPVFVLLVGNNGVGPIQLEEYDMAHELRKIIVPVTLPGANSESIPASARTLHRIEVASARDETKLNRLSELIPRRFSWEHYGDSLYAIQGFQIAYLPVLNRDLHAPEFLERGQIEFSTSTESFSLDEKFPDVRSRHEFTNDPSARLSSYSLRPRIRFQFSKTYYEDFLRSGEVLDYPVDGDPKMTYRRLFGAFLEDEDTGNLRPFELTNICGVGVFVVTRDKMVIICRHSEKSHVYPGRFTFTASGTVKWSTSVDPFSQIVRRTWEECRHQIDLTRLRLFGFGADARKLYFQFSFVEQTEVSWPELQEAWAGLGNDAVDLDRFTAVPLEPEELTPMMLEECWEPAAEAGLLMLSAENSSSEEVEVSLKKRRRLMWRRNMRDEWDYRAFGPVPDTSVRYAEEHVSDPVPPHVQTILEVAGDTLRNARALEIGAGTGRLTAALAGKARQLDAVDLSAQMIALNRKRLAKLSEQIRYHEGFAQEMDLSGYDVAFCSLVLIHNVGDREFGDLVRVLSRAAEVVIVCEDITKDRPTSPRTRIRTPAEIISAFHANGQEIDGAPTTADLYGDEIWVARFVRRKD